MRHSPGALVVVAPIVEKGAAFTRCAILFLALTDVPLRDVSGFGVRGRAGPQHANDSERGIHGELQVTGSGGDGLNIETFLYNDDVFFWGGCPGRVQAGDYQGWTVVLAAENIFVFGVSVVWILYKGGVEGVEMVTPLLTQPH